MQQDPMHAFSGTLALKNKTELGDILIALGLPVDGKKDDLRQRLEDHFKTFPDLKNNVRYAGLFTHRTRRSQVATSAVEQPGTGPSHMGEQIPQHQPPTFSMATLHYPNQLNVDNRTYNGAVYYPTQYNFNS